MKPVTEKESVLSLCNAIVVQAAEDYGNVLLGHRVNTSRGKYPTKEFLEYICTDYFKMPITIENIKYCHAQYQKDWQKLELWELEQFFHGETFDLVCSIPADAIIAEVRKQVAFWPRRCRFQLVGEAEREALTSAV